MKLTVSPCVNSPVTDPVMATVPEASSALIISSDVIASTMTLPTPAVSTLWVETSLAVIAFPAASDPDAVTVKSVSAARSDPATSTLQFPSLSTVPE